MPIKAHTWNAHSDWHHCATRAHTRTHTDTPAHTHTHTHTQNVPTEEMREEAFQDAMALLRGEEEGKRRAAVAEGAFREMLVCECVCVCAWGVWGPRGVCGVCAWSV